MKELNLHEMKQTVGGNLFKDLGIQFGRWVEQFDNSHIPRRKNGYNPYA